LFFFLWSRKVQYPVYKIYLLVPILSQLNPYHIIKYNSFKIIMISCKVSLMSIPCLNEWFHLLLPQATSLLPADLYYVIPSVDVHATGYRILLHYDEPRNLDYSSNIIITAGHGIRAV
jgi:hypothetical protein